MITDGPREIGAREGYLEGYIEALEWAKRKLVEGVDVDADAYPDSVSFGYNDACRQFARLFHDEIARRKGEASTQTEEKRGC